MATFRYRALSATGQVVTGEVQAVSRDLVIRQLHERGLLPIRAEEQSAAIPWLRFDLFAPRSPSYSELAIVFQELATLLHAGLALDRSLDVVAELASSRSLRKALTDVLARVRNGASLADAVAAHESLFPGLVVPMLRAGEAGGFLEEALRRLADFLSRSHAVRESVKSALIYPMILLVVSGISLTVIMTVVVPELRPLFRDAGAALPFATKLVLGASEIFNRHGWSLAIGLLLVVLLVGRLWRLPAIRLRRDALVLRLPLLRDLVVKSETARFSRTLGTLLKNGVTLPRAMAITTQTIGNAVIARAVENITASLKEGAGLSAPFAEAKVFPPLAVQLLRVGEEAGNLDEMLLRQADIYEREVQRTVDRLLALLVPAVTIGLGLVIGGIVASILAAILSVYDIAL